jgi:proliferating cell nuclear antigen
MKILELKTIQCSIFKTLIEALKEILIDVNMEFSKNCIKVVKMDITHTVLVNLNLNTNNFEHYKCDYPDDKPLVLGINILYLFRLLKTLNNNDILSLYIDDKQPGVLDIRLENNSKNTITKYLLNLIEIDEEILQMPSTTFDMIIKYNSTSFQKLIKDMAGLSKTIEIKSYNKQLFFSCTGEFASQETIIGENTTDICFEKYTDTIIQGCYLSRHLLSFTKCTNLCDNIKLYLKNDYPLIIEYEISNLGSITLVVATKNNNN